MSKSIAALSKFFQQTLFRNIQSIPQLAIMDIGFYKYINSTIQMSNDIPKSFCVLD